MNHKRVTEHYQIHGEVPFIDVRTSTDTPLFLLPTAIKRSGLSPWSAAAGLKLESFSRELIRCRLSASSLDTRKGLSLLQTGLSEPKETRLGYSVYGSSGHGWGPGLGRYLWNQLNMDLCRESLLQDLEHLPLFVPKVERDLISDMTTRIIYRELVEFTQAMMRQHPKLSNGARPFTFSYWDSAREVFARASATLPWVHGRPLLLVPKGWGSANLILKPTQYYNRFTTSAVQEERTRYVGKKKFAPYKRELHTEFPEVRAFNVQQTLRSAGKGLHLVKEYEAFATGEVIDLGDHLLRPAG